MGAIMFGKKPTFSENVKRHAPKGVEYVERHMKVLGCKDYDAFVELLGDDAGDSGMTAFLGMARTLYSKEGPQIMEAFVADYMDDLYPDAREKLAIIATRKLLGVEPQK